MMKEILIIKLGALGDVIRTLPIAQGIKEKYPNSHITWITKENALDLFEGNSFVDKVFSLENYPKKSFDILYNFDIDDEATKLASEIDSKNKYGFYFEEGFPASFNPGAEYYLNTLFDDGLKKKNKKTYQEMMFETAELECKKQHCLIYLNSKDKKYAENFIKENNIDTKKLIGIHIGASPRWPSKKWSQGKIREFIIKADKKGHNILLFGGPNEKQEHFKLISELKKQGMILYQNNPENTLKEFASLINLCNVVICSDTFAMHVSLAMKKPTLGLFFCTSPHEVEGYGLLTKIVSPVLEEFFPEKMDQYNEELVNSISAEEVLNALEIGKTINVVNAIIKNPKENKFLVIKRKNEQIHSGKWAFPGGVIEEGETLEQSLKREIMEEVGLEVKKIIKKISEYDYLREDNSKTKGECFLVETNNFDVKINDEVQDFKWVSLEGFEELDYVKGLDGELLTAFSELQNK